MERMYVEIRNPEWISENEPVDRFDALLTYLADRCEPDRRNAFDHNILLPLDRIYQASYHNLAKSETLSALTYFEIEIPFEILDEIVSEVVKSLNKSSFPDDLSQLGKNLLRAYEIAKRNHNSLFICLNEN